MAIFPQIQGPEYVKRREWMFVDVPAAAVLLLICGAEAAEHLAGKGGTPLNMAFVVAFIAIIIASQIWYFRTRNALRQKAEAAEYTLCTRCAYDISQLERSRKEGPEGRHVRCPECGTLVDAREARVLWREYLMS